MGKWTGRRIAFRIIRFLGLLYFGMILCACLSQRRLIYQPDKITLEAGVAAAAPHGFEPWRNDSGQYIGWKQIGTSPGARGRILIVHGNGGSAIDRLFYVDKLQAVLPLDVYILEYPGYGPRPGAPTQKSLFAAADEAIGLLKREGPVYLMGESLGTGVAAYLAGTYPELVRGVLLIAPYHNFTEVAAYHMPLLPVRWLLLDKYPSAKYLAAYHGPVAVLVAARDELVPNQFGRRLYDAYPGPKKLWEDADATHNSLIGQSHEWWAELAAFWKQYGN